MRDKKGMYWVANSYMNSTVNSAHTMKWIYDLINKQKSFKNEDDKYKIHVCIFLQLSFDKIVRMRKRSRAGAHVFSLRGFFHYCFFLSIFFCMFPLSLLYYFVLFLRRARYRCKKPSKISMCMSEIVLVNEILPLIIFSVRTQTVLQVFPNWKLKIAVVKSSSSSLSCCCCRRRRSSSRRRRPRETRSHEMNNVDWREMQHKIDWYGKICV